MTHNPATIADNVGDVWGMLQEWVLIYLALM
jgi:Na+/H+-translocating membrane pyrophosphatase